MAGDSPSIESMNPTVSQVTPGYAAPANLGEALALLAADSRGAVIAGGTDLAPAVRAGRLKPELLIDLRRLPLNKITVEQDYVHVGARVTFTDMLSQTIKGATRPDSGGLGGTNPQQIGLGTRVGSIDTLFTQGNFQTTGLTTDLAIQGNGFFILDNGNGHVYSRAGVFGLDSSSYLVNPSTGWHVQGVMADADGNIGTGPLTDIFIDPGLVMPAEASTMVQLMGNLDAASDSTGTRATPWCGMARDSPSGSLGRT